MWQNATKIVPLTKDHVHIWKANIASLEQSESLASLLTQEERFRAGRYRFAADRKRFVLSRGILRYLLGQYLDRNGHLLVFSFSTHGKPRLLNFDEISFNISHARDQAIFGFTLRRDLGVDVEYHHKNIEIQDIAVKFFSSREKQEVLSLPIDHQLDAFYRCWTRKEAFIKAIGGGLSIPLDRFAVSVLPNFEPRLTSVTWENLSVDDWTLISCSPAEHYSAAAIVKHPNPIFSFYDFEGFEGTFSQRSLLGS